MKQEDERYEELLKQLKTQLPVPNNPDLLTENILRQIALSPFLPKRKRRRLAIIAWASGIAASLLCCLLVAEWTFVPAISSMTVGEMRTEKVTDGVKTDKVANHIVHAEPHPATLTLVEKNKRLLSVLQSRQKDRHEKEIAYARHINEQKEEFTKYNRYENN